MDDPDQRLLLGQFVRAHRERMAPEGPSGRRRTPGLRREDLAARAGISATWCAWIEQGRQVQASAHTLGRLATALNLTGAERAYMFELAGRRDPDAAAAQPAASAPASLLALVAAVPHPAYGLDRLWNACCWNSAAEQLFAAWLGPGRQRNLLHYVFLDPAARIAIPQWQDRAARVLAEFRADYGRTLGDPRARALVEDLRRLSPVFSAAWDDQEVLAREGGVRLLAHPADGVRPFVQHTFSPADRPDYKFVMLIPAEDGAELQAP